MAGRERATGGGGESTGVGAGNFQNVQHRGGLEWAAGTRARAGGGKPGKRDVNRASFSTNRQRWPKTPYTPGRAQPAPPPDERDEQLELAEQFRRVERRRHDAQARVICFLFSRTSPASASSCDAAACPGSLRASRSTCLFSRRARSPTFARPSFSHPPPIPFRVCLDVQSSRAGSGRRGRIRMAQLAGPVRRGARGRRREMVACWRRTVWIARTGRLLGSGVLSAEGSVGVLANGRWRRGSGRARIMRASVPSCELRERTVGGVTYCTRLLAFAPHCSPSRRGLGHPQEGGTDCGVDVIRIGSRTVRSRRRCCPAPPSRNQRSLTPHFLMPTARPPPAPPPSQTRARVCGSGSGSGWGAGPRGGAPSRSSARLGRSPRWVDGALADRVDIGDPHRRGVGVVLEKLRCCVA
ncbi:hypothetical protein FB451DRAFT_1174237 [Mycena latifolia]|nr:hypothetical protein FB451DRAFT_1174237 [Mycena latifolia]